MIDWMADMLSTGKADTYGQQTDRFIAIIAVICGIWFIGGEKSKYALKKAFV